MKPQNWSFWFPASAISGKDASAFQQDALQHILRSIFEYSFHGGGSVTRQEVKYCCQPYYNTLWLALELLKSWSLLAVIKADDPLPTPGNSRAPGGAAPRRDHLRWTLFIYLFIWPRCAACGILVPWPGIEPSPSAVKAPSPNHWTAREFPQKTSKYLGDLFLTTV